MEEDRWRRKARKTEMGEEDGRGRWKHDRESGVLMGIWERLFGEGGGPERVRE